MPLEFLKFDLDEHRFTYIVYRHYGDYSERDGSRVACCYFGYVVLPQGIFGFSGYAGLKDPSAILAYAIVHAARAADEITGLENTQLRIFLRNRSAQTHIEQYLPVWELHDGCNRYGEVVREFSEWRKIRDMRESKQIVFECVKNSDFSTLFRDADLCCASVGKNAVEAKAHTHAGIWPNSQTHALAKNVIEW